MSLEFNCPPSFLEYLHTFDDRSVLMRQQIVEDLLVRHLGHDFMRDRVLSLPEGTVATHRDFENIYVWMKSFKMRFELHLDTSGEWLPFEFRVSTEFYTLHWDKNLRDLNIAHFKVFPKKFSGRGDTLSSAFNVIRKSIIWNLRQHFERQLDELVHHHRKLLGIEPR